jgi:hypothetical protein
MRNLTTEELTELFPLQQGQDCGCGQGQTCFNWQVYTHLNVPVAVAAGWRQVSFDLWENPISN